MTPAARISAAIGILEDILDGSVAEAAISTWARGARFAGSKDRAAVRDHVFDALRCKRSYAALGGAMSGRGLLIGALRDQGIDPATLFTGDGHAPAPLEGEELASPRDLTRAEALDCPEWLLPLFDAGTGGASDAALTAMRKRGPLFLRVNPAKATVAEALAQLTLDGVTAEAHTTVEGALRVTANPRRVQMSEAYLTGMVEVQDASSQAAVAMIPLTPGQSVLDYCAGGGGKSLALAARGADVTAHDIAPRRMADFPARAARAGVRIRIKETYQELGRNYDVVFCDAPCSGSGTWRRNPEAKWALTPAALADFHATQVSVLTQAAPLVKDGGILAYATCSVLTEENDATIAAFLAQDDTFSMQDSFHWVPGDDGDGFYLALIKKS